MPFLKYLDGIRIKSMMIQAKVTAEQFYTLGQGDFSAVCKNGARSHPQHHWQHQLQPLSPPLQTSEIYHTYSYQQKMQLLQSPFELKKKRKKKNSFPEAVCPDVLDLSRRDVVTTAPNTPPYYLSLSLGCGSPAGSPNSLKVQEGPFLSRDLSYGAQQPPHRLATLSGIHANLYDSTIIKQEKMPTTPSPPTTPTPPNVPVGQSAKADDHLLHRFTSAAAFAAAASCTHDHNSKHYSPSAAQSTATTVVDTPTISTSNIAALDPKNTRPFKAFPRDPSVIAANFVATDVLLDNKRVERYTEYRNRVLEQIRNSNGGSRTISNPKMRRTNSCINSTHEGNPSISEGVCSASSENDDRQHEEFSDSESCSGNDRHSAINSKPDGSSNGNNIASSGGSILKDAAYYERRRKNNEAAKKSRDRRRIKEDEIAIRAAYLERQNIELLCQIEALKSQIRTLTSTIS